MYPIKEYFNRIVMYPSLALNKDGKRLAYHSSLTGAPRVWIGEVKEGQLLGYPKPLTHGEGEQPSALSGGALEWIGNERLVCLMDVHGDEVTFLEIHNFKTGEVQRIPGTGTGRDQMGFATDDQKHYHFTSNRDNPSSQGLFSYSLKTGKVEKWYQHEDQSAFWHGNKIYKGHLLFGLAISNTSTTLHAIHPKTKKVIDIYTDSRATVYPICVMSGDRILVLSNHGRQFMGLAILSVKTKDLKYLGPDRWDIESAELSANKKTLITSRNVAGRSQLEIYAWPSLKRQSFRGLGKGVIEDLAISKNSQVAVFGYSSPVEPRNAYLLNLKTRKTQKLTDNWISRVPGSELSEPKLVQYESEGQKIYSWLLIPKGAKKNSSLPVVVWPHGGPQAQERAQFRPIFQYLLSRGFAVWAPNHTGSTGFGIDFTNAINQKWGIADLPDMKNGLEWLKKSGWINPKRIGIMGGSYGGYMTLRSITRLPESFKAAVDVFGPSNLLTMLKSVPPDWLPYMKLMIGDLDKDEARLREQSPIFSVEKIQCPLLVIQGARDPRVVKAESDQIVEELRGQKKSVEYLVFDDEGHGFLKLDNELKAYTRAAEFLEKWL